MEQINVKDVLEKGLDNFRARVLPAEWFPRSILLSESFAFCALADSLDVDLLIESGIYNGRSTEIWRKYFDVSVPIKTIDLTIKDEVVQRLNKYENIEFIKGNGIEVVSDLVSKNTDRKIALFLDGPKGIPAIELAKKCFQFDNVLIAGIHDLHKMTITGKNKNRIAMDEWDKTVLLTDEEWFLEKYSSLDENESNYDPEQDHKWTPYEIVECNPKNKNRKLGSYGPTAGFALNV
jgi:hypothetical protein